MIRWYNEKNKLDDRYIFLLTDDTGILQHSKYGVPDPRHGYTTDDNARALIMAIVLYEKYRKKKYLDLVYRYSSFVLNALNDRGRFKNFMSYDRKWLEEEGSEDCFGRCLWALGYAFSNKYTPVGVKSTLAYIFKKALPNVNSLTYLRAKAYSIIGIDYMGDEEGKKYIVDIADSLCNEYYKSKSDRWSWFENTITYSNSVLPWSLFKAYRSTGNEKYLDIAKESLDFLESVTFENGVFKPVGCNGWLIKGERCAEFDQQPVEACETVLTYMEAYLITGNSKYKKMAKRCHEWYEGVNFNRVSLVDRENGGCFDGLTDKGYNWNKGSESLISYVISFINSKE
ncbi:UNVERIFIED_CONTAM: hypothetical protein Cloal_3826 [Acetivibrio alkalicellulosi]